MMFRAEAFRVQGSVALERLPEYLRVNYIPPTVSMQLL